MSAEPAGSRLQATASDELWDGEMTPVTVDGIDLTLLRVAERAVAYEDKCPHSGTPLSEGSFEGGLLTCRSHLWQFDAANGSGINPKNCRLNAFRVKEEDGIVYVRLDG
jgi:toluene monooxygenase system ferredoxin subunit